MRLVEVGLAWLGYFALHSLLATTGAKEWVGRHWPQIMPSYRLAFNAIALLTLLPLLWLVYSSAGGWLWQWRGALAWLANGLSLAAILSLFVSARAYDMGEFLGLRQLREQANDVPQTFTLSPWHRFVRHPWYCLSLVLIWTRDMNGPLLISGLAISLYFVVGSKWEEQKLIACFGARYRRYMAAVPGLIPLPWKYLSASEAKALSNSSALPHSD